MNQGFRALQAIAEAPWKKVVVGAGGGREIFCPTVQSCSQSLTGCAVPHLWGVRKGPAILLSPKAGLDDA